VAQWALEYFAAWLTISLLSWGVVTWFAGAGLEPLPGPLMDALPIAVAVAGGLTVVVAPMWRYHVHRWEVSSDVVYTRTGWFSRHWLLVPVSRIQTVDTGQGWVERLLGLATLRVHTASHLGSSKVSGLPLRTATELAAELARRAHARRDDAT
jgi:membrane protein YdbS with pleckstrin-like domain